MNFARTNEITARLNAICAEHGFDMIDVGNQGEELLDKELDEDTRREFDALVAEHRSLTNGVAVAAWEPVADYDEEDFELHAVFDEYEFSDAFDEIERACILVESVKTRLLEARAKREQATKGETK